MWVSMWPQQTACDTVDGSEIRRENQLRLVVYPIIYRVLYIPGGCWGFLPSTVCHEGYAYASHMNERLYIVIRSAISKTHDGTTATESHESVQDLEHVRTITSTRDSLCYYQTLGSKC